MHRLIPGSELRIFEESSHSVGSDERENSSPPSPVSWAVMRKRVTYETGGYRAKGKPLNRSSIDNEALDATVELLLRAARIPGAAIAIVAGGRTVFAKGYGYRDLGAKLPVTADTHYPIGSTTKAINATLIGMLVDEGRLAWDVPVQ